MNTLTAKQPVSPNMNNGAKIRSEICSILHWTEEEYWSLFFDSGLDYIDNLPIISDLEKERFKASVAFWRWYRQWWRVMDVAFILYKGSIPKLSPSIAALIYATGKTGDILIKEQLPNKVVFDSIMSEI